LLSIFFSVQQDEARALSIVQLFQFVPLPDPQSVRAALDDRLDSHNSGLMLHGACFHSKERIKYHTGNLPSGKFCWISWFPGILIIRRMEDLQICTISLALHCNRFKEIA